jgi:hypothetical protein
VRDLRAGYGLCGPDIVRRLKTHPELRGGFEPVRQPQCRIATYRSLAIYDLADAVGRNSNLPGELSRRHAESIQFFGKHLAGM